MSDLRDPEDRTEIPELSFEPAPRRTMVSRVIAPLRRVVPALRGRQPVDDPSRPLLDPELEPRRGPKMALWISFIVIVLLPVTLGGGYLFVVATDQYNAEARFAVRANGSDEGGKGDTSVAGLLSGSGSLGGQDANIVASYIHSRAIIEDISRTIDVRAIFQRPEADFLARLPANASVEDLTDYWNKMITVYIESISGIVTVDARAFRREDALVLVQAVVKASEKLVNELSTNVRADAMKHAEEEVRRSEGLVRFALSDLTAFRNSQGLIDPVKAADQTGKLLLQLMTDEIQTESQLFVAQRVMGPNAPGITGTRLKLQSINDHIAKLRQQLAGDKESKSNMAASISRFEELELKRQFAERLYGFAQEGIERARLLAEQRSVYLAVFVPPSLPEDYTFPLRSSNFMIIAAACLITWISGITMTASVLDHRL
jgi:capsular polysaccharide transport system permease protein